MWGIRQCLTPKIRDRRNISLKGIVACGVLLATNGGFLLLKFRNKVVAKIIHIFSLKPCSGILTVKIHHFLPQVPHMQLFP